MKTVSGVVEHGDARGRELGFPTANLSIESHEELDGVWAATVDIESLGRYQASVAIGRRPTFYGASGKRLVEVHVLDFSADLYDRILQVDLLEFIRPEVRCADVAELISLMRSDVEATRRILAERYAHGCQRAGMPT